MIIPFGDKAPRIDSEAYVHQSAQIIGDVHLAAGCSVWFNTVIRGDVHSIRIGAGTNIQDNATIHVTSGRWSTTVGRDVTVAHGVVLHGCTVGDRCLVGIGAIVLDGAEIGEECLIAAGTLVPPRMRIPPRRLVLGSPARIIRPLNDDELLNVRTSGEKYLAYAKRYRSEGIF